MTEEVRQHQTNPARTAAASAGSTSSSNGTAAVTTSSQANQVDGDRFVLIRIEGMHCHRCEQAIKKTLQRKPGVHEVEVDFASGQASVLFNPSLITVDELIQGVKETGYKPVGFNQSHAADAVS
jgi:copper chaperone CopZ